MPSIQRSDYRCVHHLRVRWAEVDMQKIVFNAHYLMYFDTANADYWRALALPYEAAMQQLGGDVYLKKASVEYHASARYDDLLNVALKCARVGTSSIVFEGAIFRDDTLVVTAELVYVYANPVTQASQPVPASLRTIFEGFEAGAPMTRLELGNWDTLAAPASALRTEVFVQEQGIGSHMVWDAADASAVHAVVFNHLGQAVASGRLLQHAPGISRIGRMAVHRGLRGSQLGRQVLAALVDAARLRGDTEVMLHAQSSAEGFYVRSGFVARGAVFEEAGLRHLEMVLPLASEAQ